MKIAIPVWENRVSPVFDTSTHILVADIKENRLVSKEIISLQGITLYQRIELLHKLRIRTFICCAVTRPLLESILGKNIKAVSNICGDIDQILDAVCKGKDIKALFSMPGSINKEKK